MIPDKKSAPPKTISKSSSQKVNGNSTPSSSLPRPPAPKSPRSPKKNKNALWLRYSQQPDSQHSPLGFTASIAADTTYSAAFRPGIQLRINSRLASLGRI